MAATGDEAASIAQAAKALDVDAQSSGATGDESVRLRQLKMLRDSAPSIETCTVTFKQGDSSTAYDNVTVVYYVDANGSAQLKTNKIVDSNETLEVAKGSIVVIQGNKNSPNYDFDFSYDGGVSNLPFGKYATEDVYGTMGFMLYFVNGNGTIYW